MLPDYCVNYGKICGQNKSNENEMKAKNAHAMGNFPLIDKCELKLVIKKTYTWYACDYHLLCVFPLRSPRRSYTSMGKKEQRKNIFEIELKKNNNTNNNSPHIA